MKIWRFVLLTLAWILPIFTGGVTPLAYASPPDMAWLPGMYDAADYDDVVILITSGDAVWPVGRADLGPTWQAVGFAQQHDVNAVIAFILSLSQPRAPPAP